MNKKKILYMFKDKKSLKNLELLKCFFNNYTL